MNSTHAPMMKQRGREHMGCNSRRCPSTFDSRMVWYRKGTQRAKEEREWRTEQAEGNDCE